MFIFNLTEVIFAENIYLKYFSLFSKYFFISVLTNLFFSNILHGRIWEKFHKLIILMQYFRFQLAFPRLLTSNTTISE